MVPVYTMFTVLCGIGKYVHKCFLLIYTESYTRSNESIEDRKFSLSWRMNKGRLQRKPLPELDDYDE